MNAAVGRGAVTGLRCTSRAPVRHMSLGPASAFQKFKQDWKQASKGCLPCRPPLSPQSIEHRCCSVYTTSISISPAGLVCRHLPALGSVDCGRLSGWSVDLVTDLQPQRATDGTSSIRWETEQAKRVTVPATKMSKRVCTLSDLPCSTSLSASHRNKAGSTKRSKPRTPSPRRKRSMQLL